VLTSINTTMPGSLSAGGGEDSYQANLLRGVTGPHTNTCEVAAFELLSPHTTVSPKTHEAHECRQQVVARLSDSVHAGELAPGDRTRLLASSSQALHAFCGDFEVPPTDILRTRVCTANELNRTLGRLSAANRRTALVLDVGSSLHAVGVTAVHADFCGLTSTWTPFSDGSLVHMDEIFPLLNQKPNVFTQVASGASTVTNVISLPPEHMQ